MTQRNGEIRSALVHHFNAAHGYAGGCTQGQREAAHYQRGRKDGIAQALELVDMLIRADEGQSARTRPVDEIVAAVQSTAPV